MIDSRLEVFFNACEREFAWVESQIHFHRAKASLDNLVEFRSDRASLVVGWVTRVSEPSKRIDAELNDLRLERRIAAGKELAANRGWSYGIGTVARYLDPSLTDTQIRHRFGGYWFYGDTPEEIESSVARMSHEWQSRLTHELVECDEFWTGLDLQKMNTVMSLGTDRSRENAINAFREGDYERTLELYEQVPGELLGADKKRIEIAKRHLSL